MNKHIRLAKIEDVDYIIEVLNEVTLYLQRKGINQWEYPWNFSKIKTDILNRNVYVLVLGDSIIGTFSIKAIEKDIYERIRNDSLYLYRIAIKPQMQGKGLGREIINYCCEYARKQSKSLYLDCWSGNEKLRKFYSNASLEYLGDFPEEDYYISVFRYDLVSD